MNEKRRQCHNSQRTYYSLVWSCYEYKWAREFWILCWVSSQCRKHWHVWVCCCLCKLKSNVTLIGRICMTSIRVEFSPISLYSTFPIFRTIFFSFFGNFHSRWMRSVHLKIKEAKIIAFSEWKRKTEGNRCTLYFGLPFGGFFFFIWLKIKRTNEPKIFLMLIASQSLLTSYIRIYNYAVLKVEKEM